MTIWIDAQISPHLALWLSKQFSVEAKSLEFLELDEAEDDEIFAFAKEENAVILTKDEDFIRLQAHLGSPPQIIWVSCGNTSNQYLRALLTKTMTDVIEELKSGSQLVEISDAVFSKIP